MEIPVETKGSSRRQFCSASVGAVASSYIARFLAAQVASVNGARADTPAALADPSVPDWAFSVRRKIGNTVYVYCASFDLNPAVVDPTADLAVYAHELNLAGSIGLPGRKVLLHARRITVANGAQIDVSGTPGSGWPPGSRQDGQNPGSQGGEGDAGQPGKDAGSVEIYAEAILGALTIQANGGAGGRGRDGGNGAQGALGQTGGDANCGRNEGAGGRGGAGVPGGDAGAGGKGGNGGQGGSITVLTLNQLPPSLALNALGGAVGATGQAGQPGSGGLGGVGGMGRHTEWISCSRGSDCPHCVDLGRAPSGPAGPVGRSAVAVLAAVPGKQGTVRKSTATLADFSSRANVAQLQLLAHKAAVDYLSQNYQATGDLIAWLQFLTSQVPPGTAVAAEWNSLNRLANMLASQLVAGLGACIRVSVRFAAPAWIG